MAVKIVIESTSDLTTEEIEKYNLHCARLTINWDGSEYIDGIDLTKKEFFVRLVEGKTLPTTSQVPAPIFQEIFKQVIQDGDEVVAILLSKKFSGTYQSANMARDLMGENRNKIYLVDSNTTTLGTAVLIYEAIKLRDAGKSAVEMVLELEDLAKRVQILAAVETLKFLHRGGRLSGGAAVMGTLLSVKPILQVANGEIKVIHKTRGNGAAYKWLGEKIKEVGMESGRTVMVGSTQCPDLMNQFVQNITNLIDKDKIKIGEIGTVVGTHAGPGCVGCAFILSKK